MAQSTVWRLLDRHNVTVKQLRTPPSKSGLTFCCGVQNGVQDQARDHHGMSFGHGVPLVQAMMQRHCE